MVTADMQLAELNIARPRYALDDPRIAPFMTALDAINAIADRSPGFVWRLQGEGSDATDLALEGEANAIVNMTVWRSAEDLERFVWRTVHAKFYNRKSEWFAAMREAYFVMWWVPAGHRPDLGEAAERLAHLRAHGDTERAFGWSGLPDVNLWRTRQCA